MFDSRGRVEDADIFIFWMNVNSVDRRASAILYILLHVSKCVISVDLRGAFTVTNSSDIVSELFLFPSAHSALCLFFFTCSSLPLTSC